MHQAKYIIQIGLHFVSPSGELRDGSSYALRYTDRDFALREAMRKADMYKRVDIAVREAYTLDLVAQFTINE